MLIINFQVLTIPPANNLFRLGLELTTHDTKKHKIVGLFKMIKVTDKNQAIIIIEFSFARKASATKEDDDQVKLCRNSI